MAARSRSRRRLWLVAIVLLMIGLAVAYARGVLWAPSGSGVVLVVPRDGDALTERLSASTAAYLGTIAGAPVEPLRVDPAELGGLPGLEALAEEHRAGLVVVLEAERFAPQRVDGPRLEALGPGGFVLETVDVGGWSSPLGDDEAGATIVLTAGGGRLSRQYAVYELLRRLGARFFHPEQEYVPTQAAADLRALARRPTARHREGQRDYVPDFAHRSWSFHSPHPLEHLEAFSDPAHPIDEAVHVNEWIVKNLGDSFRGLGRGTASAEDRARRGQELEALRDLLGFPRGTGISLHNLQQGASAEIDPSAATPVREQIEALVASRLESTPDARSFGIHFGVTEFNTTPDTQTVRWIDWAGQAALRLRPDLRVMINNHITGGQPSPNFDDLGCSNGTNDQGRADYYDLAFHTDPRLGVQVHTVMFYPLEGPALVYNQRSFAHKRCLMERASAQGRPLQWFPEGSWWLSFDNPIPVYLPLYVWTRARDVELLRPLLASRGGGTLDGHRMFNSGHEWGYWQQDYAVGMMAWNADVTVAQALGEMLEPLCEPAAWREGCAARREALAVLQEVIEHQRALFLAREDFRGRPGGLYAYFAGEDDADAIAADSGFEFRPVRVPFAEVLEWDAEAIEQFRGTDLAALHEAAEAYGGWTARLVAVEGEVPAAGRPWLSEIRDGVEIDGLRARQTALLYQTVIELREAQLAEAPEPVDAVRETWARALETLVLAQRVIQHREAAYRYPPAQTHGGGLTEGTAVDNGTPYPYRVHTKTHLLTYWTNRHNQVAQVLAGGSDVDPLGLRLHEAIDRSGTPVTVRWPALGNLGGAISIGGLLVEPPTEEVDLGDAPGYWEVSGQITSDGPPLTARGGVARSDVLATTPAGGMTLLEPDDPSASGVLGSVLPALRWAWLEQPAALVFAPDDDGDGSVDHERLVYAQVTEGDAAGFITARVTFELPVALSSGGDPLSITVSEATFAGRVEGGALVDPVVLEAQLSIDDIVAAAIELAGFDEVGTLELLGGIWGFDPANPPETAPMLAELHPEGD